MALCDRVRTAEHEDKTQDSLEDGVATWKSLSRPMPLPLL
jgi:hypothetical protein